MGRKRKKLVAVDDKLPPCRICDGPAAGFHYGVNTCDACKGFFHRSLSAHVTYKCRYDQNCNTTFWSKLFCHWCRYKKCLQMGMSKAAIKTGRYSTFKKKKDKLEVNQHRSQNSNEHPAEQSVGYEATCNVKTPNSLSDSDDTNFPTEKKHLDIRTDKSALDIHIHKKEFDIRYDHCPLDIHTDNEHFFFHSEKNWLDIQHSKKKRFDDHTDFHPVNNRLEIHLVTSRSNIHPPNNHLNIRPVSNRLDVHPVSSNLDIHPGNNHSDIHHVNNNMDIHPVSNHLDVKPDKSDGDVIQEYTASRFYPDDQNGDLDKCNVVNYSNDKFSHGIIHVNSPPEKVRVQEFSSSEKFSTVSLPQTLHRISPVTELPPESKARSQSLFSFSVASEMSSLFDGCSIGQDNGSDLDGLFQDNDAFIKNLLKAFNQHIKPRFIQGTPEEIEQMQREHLEECKLRKNMYGHLGDIPDGVYDEIFNQTGIDIDNRIQVWNTFSECVEDMIQGMVEFAKVIPGFTRLYMSEKINLIKFSRQEVVYVLSSQFANMELGVFPCFMKLNKWICFAELKNTACEYLAKDFLDFFTKIQELEITDEERILMCAIILMNPDRNSKTQTPAVNQIHWHLIECLLHQMSMRFQNPLRPFTDIVSCFTLFKDIEWKLKSNGCNAKHIGKYINLKDKPLFNEVMSGVLVDE